MLSRCTIRLLKSSTVEEKNNTVYIHTQMIKNMHHIPCHLQHSIPYGTPSLFIFTVITINKQLSRRGATTSDKLPTHRELSNSTLIHKLLSLCNLQQASRRINVRCSTVHPQRTNSGASVQPPAQRRRKRERKEERAVGRGARKRMQAAPLFSLSTTSATTVAEVVNTPLARVQQRV